jgi:hypothetical protein
LDSQQVVSKWTEVEPILLDALSHRKIKWTEQEKLNLMQAIATGKLQCWGIFRGKEIIAFATTLITTELWGERNLLIYSLTGFDNITLPIWHKMLSSVVELAKKENLGKIVAYSDNARVIQIITSYGGKDVIHLLELEV